MHRKANSNSNHVVSSIHNGRYHIAILPILGIATSLGLSTLLPSPNVSAKAYLDGSAVSIVISDDPSTTGANNYTLRPSSTGNSYAAYRKFVDIDVYGSEDYSIYIKSSNQAEHEAVQNNTWSSDTNYNIITSDSSLRGTKPGNTGVIVPLADPISSSAFQSSTDNVWGYRWNYTTLDTVNIPLKEATNSERITARTNANLDQSLSDSDYYYGIKADGTETRLANSSANPNGTYPTNTEKNASGRLLLEFGASVNSSLPNDTYTGYVAVSVVATPYQATLLSPLLTDMQQMTPDICAATPTPNVDAAQTATNRRAQVDAVTKSWKVAIEGLLIGTANNATNTMTYTSVSDSEFASITDPTNVASHNYVPETVLKDSRDGKYYLIRKLTDGNCWMSSNLDYRISTSTAERELKNEALSDYNGIWNNMTVYNTQTEYTPAWGTSNTDADGLRSFAAASYNNGTTAYSKKDASNFTFSSSSTGSIYEYRGTFYNWNAATLTSSKTATKAGDIAGSSICPRGWKLPDANTDSKSWDALFSSSNYNILGDSNGYKAVTEFPLNYMRTGTFYNNKTDFDDTYGIWWTSTASDSGKSYFLRIGTAVSPMYQNNRSAGKTIRCVAR